MDNAVLPEISRLELSSLVLKTLGFLEKSGLEQESGLLLNWLTSPDLGRFRNAIKLLRDLSAVEEDNSRAVLSVFGRKLLKWPAEPLQAALLEEAGEKNAGRVMCAVLAVWECQDFEKAENVLEAARDFIESPDSRVWHRDVKNTFDSLSIIAGHKAGTKSVGKDENGVVAGCFLKFFRHRFAVKEAGASTFIFSNKTTAVLAGRKGEKELPVAIIALDVLETAGSGQARRNVITAYIPISIDWIMEEFKDLCLERRICRWDPDKKAVLSETEVSFEGLPLKTKPAKNASSAEAEELLAEKCLSGEINLLDDLINTWLSRLSVLLKAFPEKNTGPLSSEDWRLIYSELCKGKSSVSELSSEKLLSEIKNYCGLETDALLEKNCPEKIILPSGKKGKIIYPENGVPETVSPYMRFHRHEGPFHSLRQQDKGYF